MTEITKNSSLSEIVSRRTTQYYFNFFKTVSELFFRFGFSIGSAFQSFGFLQQAKYFHFILACLDKLFSIWDLARYDYEIQKLQNEFGLNLREK
jgi:hypothetical protein